MLQTTSAAPLINAVLNNPDCYTSSGRLNHSELMRCLGVKRQAVNKMIVTAEEMKGKMFG